MTQYPSAQKAALAAASAAALATAAAYYIYRIRRRHISPESQPATVTAIPDSSPQDIFLPHSSRQSSIPATHRGDTREAVTKPPSAAISFNPSSQTTGIHPTSSTTNVDKESTSLSWAVFWDIENVHVPKAISAAHFVQALRNTLAAHRKQTHPDSILRIQAIANIRRTPVHLRNHLQANGVNLTHVESKGRKDAADKALITEICLITREHPTPFGICLISGDGDFSYPVARLAALGYATVVIAPTRQSFSTLLAAVPDAVIPLHVVLEGHADPSMPPEISRWDPGLLRMPNHHPLRHQIPVPMSHLNPLPSPRRGDKRLTRRRRRERVMATASLPDRDEEPGRPWSSDDDDAVDHINGNRTYHGPGHPHTFRPETERDSHVAANGFERSFISNTRMLRPRLMPSPNGQPPAQADTRRRSDRLGRDFAHQSHFHAQNGTASGTTNGSTSGSRHRMNSTRTRDVDGIGASSSTHDDRNRRVNGPRVHFAEDIIPDRDQQRTSPSKSAPRDAVTQQSGSQRPRHATGSKSQEMVSSEVSNTSEPSVVPATRCFYSGARALPFAMIVLVLVCSVLFTSLRVAIVVMQALHKV